MTATHHPVPLAGASTRRAWWSLLGFVPSFALAFLVGEGLISALGYPVGGEEQAPWWAALIAATPALLVFVLPAAAATYFGMRAMRLGDGRGRLPTTVALIVAAGFVLINAISALVTWLA
ncbi:hypothetical protein [Nocardioides astragali]|uniref:Uncharacterized protein n=1 Tax=Nocardioides astragali TaxID=1776736 RepID=A0ABW2NA38_9ACTN|nr:hypothetical protein [Nocardioides astragali]